MSQVAFQSDIVTPALVVDLERLERNVARMARWTREAGIALRPHAKTHKTVEVAERQVHAGASGLTVATLGEAEIFADAGFLDLFLATPLWADRNRSSRLAALTERARLRVGVDSVEGATALARAVPFGGLEVLIEIECGYHRTGVAPAAAATVADAAARSGLTVVGVFAFPGQGYTPGAAERGARDEANALEEAAGVLEKAGHSIQVRSGGSTPTAYHAIAGVVTELRAGVYVFNDAQNVALGTCPVEDVALAALASVVSVPSRGRVILDIGSKLLGADQPVSVKDSGFGLLPDLPAATVTSLYEQLAAVTGENGQLLPRLGETVRVIPNHVCSAVNLANELVVVNNGAVVGTWPVIARGKNT